MKRLFKVAGWSLLVLVAIGVVVLLWMKSFGKDDGPTHRPAYGTYTWPNQAPPRGGPTPRADGYVVGSQGTEAILPPMNPERAQDVNQAATIAKNAAIKSCFFPSGKGRSGHYSTDPDDFSLDNQFPDTGTVYASTWFKIPAGAHLVLKGDFPHMRHWNFITYTGDATARDALNDADIDPDAGSSNPFRNGVPRDVSPRRYSISLNNGDAPATRPKNTLYTTAAPDTAVAMLVRHYVPDRGTDWVGGVGLPEMELHLADGKVLTGDAACEATAAPLRGKALPITVKKELWLALNHLPWQPADHTPAKAFEVAPMERFFNREHLLINTFFPLLARDSQARDVGGFWSNAATRYGMIYLSQAYGKVYVVRGKMPSTPRTWAGAVTPMNQQADMRYWSLCTATAPPTGMTPDCVVDETVLPTLDAKGYFNVVVSRSIDRPANATEKCGVAWMEYGNGDGIPGGSPDYGSLINRHTLVNPNFKQSWFSVNKMHGEKLAMNDYLPYVINMREKARFEALGCPVDTARLAAMVAH